MCVKSLLCTLGTQHTHGHTADHIAGIVGGQGTRPWALLCSAASVSGYWWIPGKGSTLHVNFFNNF